MELKYCSQLDTYKSEQSIDDNNYKDLTEEKSNTHSINGELFNSSNKMKDVCKSELINEDDLDKISHVIQQF